MPQCQAGYSDALKLCWGEALDIGLVTIKMVKGMVKEWGQHVGKQPCNTRHSHRTCVWRPKGGAYSRPKRKCHKERAERAASCRTILSSCLLNPCPNLQNPICRTMDWKITAHRPHLAHCLFVLTQLYWNQQWPLICLLSAFTFTLSSTQNLVAGTEVVCPAEPAMLAVWS